MYVTEIEGMLPHLSDSDFGVAMRCVAKDMGSSIVVAYIIDDMWSFAYYEQGIEPDNHLLNDIIPSCKKFTL